MSQRLAELQRQRALLQEHLAWLDHEIAGESARGAGPGTGTEIARAAPGSAAPSSGSSVPATATTVASAADTTIATTVNVVAPASLPTGPSASGGAIHRPDEILDQYRVAPENLRNDIRKGCFLYFALAFVLLAIAVVVLYVLFRL